MSALIILVSTRVILAPSPGEKGFLCAGAKRHPVRSPLGLEAPAVYWHDHRHRLVSQTSLHPVSTQSLPSLTLVYAADFISILKEYYVSAGVEMAQLEEHRITSWRSRIRSRLGAALTQGLLACSCVQEASGRASLRRSLRVVSLLTLDDRRADI